MRALLTHGITNHRGGEKIKNKYKFAIIIIVLSAVFVGTVASASTSDRVYCTNVPFTSAYMCDDGTYYWGYGAMMSHYTPIMQSTGPAYTFVTGETTKTLSGG